VVRERAKVMKARRSRVRSLMLPLVVCSVLLLLIGLAVWTGLYQYPTEAAEAVQADVAALTASDANNQFLVVLLWFVPVSMAVLATVLYRRTGERADGEAGR
jgi:type VI protein secretion system component VasK